MLLLLTVVVMSLAFFVTWAIDGDNATDEEKVYYGSYEDSLWTIFLIITSTGFPNQILPPYDHNRGSIVFFIVVVVLGSFIILNLILLVVNSEFESGKNTRDAIEVNFRNLDLQLAFELLDVEKKNYLEYDDIERLLVKLYQISGFQDDSIPPSDMLRIMASIMDVNDNGRITLREFSLILDVIKVRLEKKAERSYMDIRMYMDILFRSFSKTENFNWYKEIIGSQYFPLCVDIAILVCLSVELWASNGVADIEKDNSLLILGIASVIMLIEALLCIITMGSLYLKDPFKKIEFTISSSSWIILITSIFTGSTVLVLCLRVLCFLRLFLSVRLVEIFFPFVKLRSTAKIFYKVLKNLRPLFITVAALLFFYCYLGMLFFGGLINKDESRGEFSRIQDSLYGENDFWPFNFNDVPSGVMTLVTLMHVSDWDVITGGFTAALDSKYPRIYFTLWYLVGVLLLLNVIKSFFIRGFFVNYEVYIGSSDKISDSNENTVGSGVNVTQDVGIISSETRSTGISVESKREHFDSGAFTASLGSLNFLTVEERLFLEKRVFIVLNGH